MDGNWIKARWRFDWIRIMREKSSVTASLTQTCDSVHWTMNWQFMIHTFKCKKEVTDDIEIYLIIKNEIIIFYIWGLCVTSRNLGHGWLITSSRKICDKITYQSVKNTVHNPCMEQAPARTIPDTWELSWCQLCPHWQHQRLLWQPMVLPVMTKLASWQLSGFINTVYM